ncbi:response regulator [Enterococcus faecium]|nr:response regulator [Enterococcus faecium]ELA88534.1 hypothetical protein OI5_05186 [Enterococcus faecium EnGen0009]EHU5001224.1 response regulator [Enterococcus faecium]ELB14824.1 hypothetical protein OIO_05023 [Enterococcus faecium EnGen0031]EOH69507.1 hypothetical protein UAG_01049 [Enterococcus faecium ATCC 8459 = NRRL B-2354]EOU02723.1 hypothetical protein I581_02512 [Enterococcus faecium ATCC 8459 = NRRL B-2354]
MKILIVDDEASILDIVEAYLSAKGYQVFRALSGNEALTKVDVVQPDLIVLDLMLPGLLVLVSNLRQLFVETRIN